MNYKTKKVKITDKETGEERIFNSILEASQQIGFKYVTINAWLNGRIESPKYIAEYIYDI